MKTFNKLSECWEEVSLSQFDKLNDILTSKEKIDDTEKAIELLVALTDSSDYEKTKEEFYSLPFVELDKFLQKIKFIENRYIPKCPNKEVIIIDGEKFSIEKNISKLKTSQYIDFQNLIKDREKNMRYIIFIFLIPFGKKYNEDYDMIELANRMYDKISITVASDMSYFFTLSWRVLMVNFLLSSIRQLKKAMKTVKEEKTKMDLEMTIQKLKKEVDSIKNGGGFPL